jgi:hypothetical protein
MSSIELHNPPNAYQRLDYSYLLKRMVSVKEFLYLILDIFRAKFDIYVLLFYCSKQWRKLNFTIRLDGVSKN